MIRALVFDVGETLIDETRIWSRWADRLGVSISGLARAEITEPLTTEQIATIKEEQPEWLHRERGLRAEVQREEERLRAERAARPPK